MSQELWKAGVSWWKDRRPEGSLRHSQVISTFGPGALIDLVEDAAIVAGLAWWAQGTQIVEDRLRAMLARNPEYARVTFHTPPPSSSGALDDPSRTWIKAFRFPEWFVCQNDQCWVDAGKPERADKAAPRRLLHVSHLDGSGHRCRGGKERASPVQPIRFVRACRMGHVDDLHWVDFTHRKHRDCRSRVLWIEETGATGDLTDVRISCSGCGESFRMSLAAQRFLENEPTLGYCTGRRPWLGTEKRVKCSEPMRLLLRSASHAYFPVNASVIHIPDQDAEIRERVDKVYELIREAEDVGQIQFFKKYQAPVRNALGQVSDDRVFAEVLRRREGHALPSKSVKDAEVEVLASCPEKPPKGAPNGRFDARALALPTKRAGAMRKVDRVVVLPRLTEVRALAGFTRFEPKMTDSDGELDIGAEVAPLAEPLRWLPAVENRGEGFFFSLDEELLRAWETKNTAAGARDTLFKKGFALWQAQRDDRKRQKPDFARARFILLHSLSHLLISTISLECGYAASSIRERIYAGKAGSGILLYTASPGADGSLGGLVEVGRRLGRYLDDALQLGRLCANDPVCAAHEPDHEPGGQDRFLEGASCHGCLLISEPSCERMNLYLDRTLVVPTVEGAAAAFFED